MAHIVSTDSCLHPTNGAWLAPWLAEAVAPMLAAPPGSEDALGAFAPAT